MRSLGLCFALQNLRANLARMSLSIAAIALGVALVVAVRLMNAAVLASFLNTVDGVAGRAALTISAGERFTFSEDVQEAVAGVPGVKLAVPLVRASAFTDDGSGELLTVHGVDLTHDGDVRVYHDSADPTDVIDDLVVFLSQPDSIVVGRQFAERRGLAVNDKLPLVTPSGVKAFTIRGLLDAQGLAKTLDGRIIVMDLLAAEKAFTAPRQINRIDVLVADGADVAHVKTGIANTLPIGLDVAEPTLRKDVIRKTIGGFQAMLTAFSLIAVVAGFVICYGRLRAVFDARTWETGVLRAIGLRRSTVFAELLKESLLLGIVGTTLGTLLGGMVARYALRFIATTSAIALHLPVGATSVTLDAWSFLSGAAVGIGAGLLAAVVPAHRLAKRRPIEALRLRGREDTHATGRSIVLLVLLIFATSAALVGWQSVSSPSWVGNVTSALIAVATSVLAGPIVRRGGRLLARVWGRVFGTTGGFAALQLSERPNAASLTVATVGLGLGAILMFGVLSWSLEQSLVAKLTARFRVDIIVTSAFESGGWVPDAVSEEVMADLRTIPGVDRFGAQAVVDTSIRGTALSLYGNDAACMTDSRIFHWPLESGAIPGALQAVADGTGALITPPGARALRVHPGDRITLDSPTGPQEFTLAGITDGHLDPALIVSRDRLRSGWNVTTVNWVNIAVAPGAVATDIEGALRRRLGETYRVRVQRTGALISHFADQVHQAFAPLYIMEIITLVLVGVGLGDTLACTVLERTREFGILRALGFRRSHVFAMIVLEGTAMGVLGFLLAMASGTALGVFWVDIQLPALLGFNMNLHVPKMLHATAGAVTLAVCILSSLLPALRAARVPSAHAMRSE